MEDNMEYFVTENNTVCSETSSLSEFDMVLNMDVSSEQGDINTIQIMHCTNPPTTEQVLLLSIPQTLVANQSIVSSASNTIANAEDFVMSSPSKHTTSMCMGISNSDNPDHYIQAKVENRGSDSGIQRTGSQTGKDANRFGGIMNDHCYLSQVCLICNKFAEKGKSLQEHAKMHKGKDKFKFGVGVFPCGCCDLMFDDWRTMVSHMEKHENENSTYLCKVCNASPYETISALKKHWQKHFLKTMLREKKTHFAKNAMFGKKEMGSDTGSTDHNEPRKSVSETTKISVQHKMTTRIQTNKLPEASVKFEEETFSNLRNLTPSKTGKNKKLKNAKSKKGGTSASPVKLKPGKKNFASPDNSKSKLKKVKSEKDDTSVSPVKQKAGKKVIASYDKSKMKFNCSAYPCCFCKKVFSSVKEMDLHIKKEYKPDMNCEQCRMCKKTFRGMYQLLGHWYSHLEERMPCNFCGKMFFSQIKLEKHVELHHRNAAEETQEANSEDSCSSKLDITLSNKDGHLHVSNDRPRFRNIATSSVCPICGKVFKSRNMASHLRGHKLKSDPWKCPCGELIDSESQRSEHIKVCRMARKLTRKSYNSLYQGMKANKKKLNADKSEEKITKISEHINKKTVQMKQENSLTDDEETDDTTPETKKQKTTTPKTKKRKTTTTPETKKQKTTTTPESKKQKTTTTPETKKLETTTPETKKQKTTTPETQKQKTKTPETQKTLKQNQKIWTCSYCGKEFKSLLGRDRHERTVDCDRPLNPCPQRSVSMMHVSQEPSPQQQMDTFDNISENMETETVEYPIDEHQLATISFSDLYE